MDNTTRKIVVLFVLLHLCADGMAKKKLAGLVVYRKSDHGVEYLMLKPKKEGKDWSPPKGRLDDGEDELTAALRETHEEVGYTADDLEIYKERRVTVNQGRKNGQTEKVTFFLAKLKSADKSPVLSHEHSEYHWLNKDQAASIYGQRGEFTDMFTQFDNDINNDLLV